MAYHLVCVHPFGPYQKGDCVTDPNEVDRLIKTREPHFQRITAPPPPKAKAPDEIDVGGTEYRKVK